MSEYKRLTHRNGNCVEEYCEVGHCKYADFRVCNFKGIEHNVDEDCISAMIERLAELEDKIEQGTLIELPCPIRTMVYYIASYEKRSGFFGKKKYSTTIIEIPFELDMLYSYGNNWFLTREEAEKRLKELQEC